MLRRINAIAQSGNFISHLSDPGLKDFATISIVYGPNGSGKSSLSNAFLSAKAGDSEVGLQIEIEEHGVRRTASQGDPVFERIHVFNRAYVTENHKFDALEPNVPSVLTLGKQKIEDLEQLEQNELAAREVAIRLAECKRDLEVADKLRNRILASVSTETVGALGAFDRRFLTRNSYRVDHVAAAYANPGTILRTLDSKEEQETLASLSAPVQAEVRIPSEPNLVPVSMTTTIRKLLESSPFTILLDTLAEAPEATSWVSEGRHLHSDRDQCIFCGSRLSEERRTAIESHFSNEVERVNTELLIHSDQISKVRAELVHFYDALPAATDVYSHLREGYTIARLGVREQIAAALAWIDSLTESIRVKRDNVLKPMAAASLESVFALDWQECKAVLTAHNQRASRSSAQVAELVDSMKYHYLASRKDDYFSALSQVAASNSEIAQLIRTMRDLEIARLAIPSRTGDPVPSADKLTRELSRLLGRKELTFRSADNGQMHVERRGMPAIGMSEGERNAISLIHFIEQVSRSDQSLGDVVMMIDDPVSSLDSNVFMGVSSFIWSSIFDQDAPVQIVLLTHNFELFRQWIVKTERLPAQVKRTHPYSWHQIVDQSRSTSQGTVREPSLASWPAPGLDAKKVRSNYIHSFIVLAERTLELHANPHLAAKMDAQLLLPNLMRRFLEGFIASRRPDMAGDINAALRDFSELLTEKKPEIEIQALRMRLDRYSNVYSHSEDPDPTAVIDPSEILPALFAMFELLRLADPGHLEGLCKVGGMESLAELLEQQ